MKIWTRNISYEKFAEIKPREHKKPRKQLWLFRPLLKLVTDIMLWPMGMKYNKTGMDYHAGFLYAKIRTQAGPVSGTFGQND